MRLTLHQSASQLAGPDLPALREPEAPAIRKLLRYIDERYAEPITLQRLSAVGGINLYTLIKHFRQEVGVTPHQYICYVRVRQAQLLLRDGLAPALTAIETGFFDQSHLARHFKRLCGTTPGRYAAALAPERVAA